MFQTGCEPMAAALAPFFCFKKKSSTWTSLPPAAMVTSHMSWLSSWSFLIPRFKCCGVMTFFFLVWHMFPASSMISAVRYSSIPAKNTPDELLTLSLNLPYLISLFRRPTGKIVSALVDYVTDLARIPDFFLDPALGGIFKQTS